MNLSFWSFWTSEPLYIDCPVGYAITAMLSVSYYWCLKPNVDSTAACRVHAEEEQWAMFDDSLSPMFELVIHGSLSGDWQSRVADRPPTRVHLNRQTCPGVNAQQSCFVDLARERGRAAFTGYLKEFLSSCQILAEEFINSSIAGVLIKSCSNYFYFCENGVRYKMS